MKKTTNLLSFLAITGFLLLQPTYADVVFEDNFNITFDGGDANYQLDASGRQSGTTSLPVSYSWWTDAVEPPLVTNAGPNAGKLFLPVGGAGGASVVIGPDYNFNSSGDFSIEVQFENLTNQDWFALNIGQDSPTANVWNDPGMTIMFYTYQGKYLVYDHWQDNHPTGDFTYAELLPASNSVLKVKVVVSQVALFINDKPYPLVQEFVPALGWSAAKYIHTYTGGFANNYFTISSYINLGIDYVKVSTPPGNSFKTKSWTGAADSGLSDTKTYTHAVNFNYPSDTIINGVTFKGSPSNDVIGTDWELRNDNNAFQIAQYGWGVNANLSSESIPLVSNCLYDAWTCGGIYLEGLDPEKLYQITLYSIGFEDATRGRPSFFATSDGAKIQILDQDEFGKNNGQIVTYKYMPSAEGKFSFATRGNLASNWIWYAFSNELAPPDGPSSISATQRAYSDKINVSWSVPNGAESYSLYRGDTTNFSLSSEIASAITTNFYSDTTVAAASEYYYWVKACSTDGCSSAAGPALGSTKSATPPDTPVNQSPVSFEEVSSPVKLTASAYSGSASFAASEWQVSPLSDFSDYNWNSGTTVTKTYFTVPGNVLFQGTNYWRVRYRDEYNTWSSWSAGTSFILTSAPAASSTIFVDTFNVSGSGDANNGFDNSCRQYGDAAPLTYKTEGTTKAGGNSDKSGWLTLGQDSGISPNHSFVETPNFNIEFDIQPHSLDNSSDRASIAFGKTTQSSFSPTSDSGLGILFYANGKFQVYSGTEQVADTTGLPTGEELHVLITCGAESLDGSRLSMSAFVNGMPMIVDTTSDAVENKILYTYQKLSGFADENYITFYNDNETSWSSTLIDNFKIFAAPSNVVKTYHWTDDSDSLIDNTKNYTHKINLNDGDVTVNGVTFEGTGWLTDAVPNGAPEITKTNWSIVSSGGISGFFDITNELSFISGSSKDLARFFAFPHGGFGFKLSGLEPFSSNRMYVYTVGWENYGSGREGIFSSSYGGAITNIDQDIYDRGGGLIVTYDYVASKDGEFFLSISPWKVLPNDTPGFHVCALANEKIGVSAPKIDVDCVMNLGEVVPGNNKTLPLLIANAGGGTVAGTITGEASPFSLDTNSYSAVAGTPDSVNVTFAPASEGSYSNVITLSGGGENAMVMLTGEAIPEPFNLLFIVWNLFFIFLWKIKK